MIDFKCSRNSSSCAGCPIIEHCEYIELTEEIDPYSLYEKGRTDAIEEMTEAADCDHANCIQYF